jgi:hypothetical protein
MFCKKCLILKRNGQQESEYRFADERKKWSFCLFRMEKNQSKSDANPKLNEAYESKNLSENK